MKNTIKIVTKFFIIFIIMLVIFSLGMIASYSLPNEKIKQNVGHSLLFIKYLYNSPVFKLDIHTAALDKYTDQLMLSTAVNKEKEENESIIIKAFENSYYQDDNENQELSLQNIINDDSLYNNKEYSRYWHGIQTLLRPLLLIFSYEEILYLLTIVLFALLILSAIFIYKNISIWHSVFFVISMMMVGFIIVPISLQYSSVFIITFISIIIINILYNKEKEKLIPYLFFIIGGCTAFFDLLTIPLLTLGIPLIITLLLKQKKEEKISIKSMIFEIIKLSFLWGIAYLSLFVSKWVIASIVLQKDAVTVAINQILFRVNGNEKYPATRIGAIIENASFLSNRVLFFLFIVTFISWIILLVKYRKEVNDIKMACIYLLIALYPYIWYFIFAGHSTIHSWFTFRLQVITIFSISCAMIECIDLKNIRK